MNRSLEAFRSQGQSGLGGVGAWGLELKVRGRVQLRSGSFCTRGFGFDYPDLLLYLLEHSYFFYTILASISVFC